MVQFYQTGGNLILSLVETLSNKKLLCSYLSRQKLNVDLELYKNTRVDSCTNFSVGSVHEVPVPACVPSEVKCYSLCLLCVCFFVF